MLHMTNTNPNILMVAENVKCQLFILASGLAFGSESIILSSRGTSAQLFEQN